MSSRNVRGGKGFKKGKKGGGEDRAQKFVGREDDQDYARILRLLGDRRVLCFCNDGYERVGKIRGALCGRRKTIISVGDIVLISYREFQEEGSTMVAPSGGGGGAAAASVAATTTALITDTGHKLIVDIMHRFDPGDWRHIRKEAGIHPALLGGGGSGALADDIFADAGAADNDNDSDLDVDAI
jgi:initiation factor 1A